MKYLLITCLMFSNLIFSSAAVAGPTMNTEVQKVRIRSHVAYVKLKDCKKYNKIYLDTEYGKAMYSAALSAATAGKQVSVEFEDEAACDTVESTFKYFEVVY